MIRPATLVGIAGLLLTLSGTAFAGNNADARLVLHLTSPTTKNQCTWISPVTCSGIVSQGSLYPAGYYAYVLVTNGDRYKGIAGLQFGINYDSAPHSGVDVLGWTLCATMQFSSPEWPASGSGNMITWDYVNACQRYEPGGPGTGVIAVAGYFYVAAYSPDNLTIIRRPVDDAAKVADCSVAESIIEGGTVSHDPPHLGYARFSASGLEPGYNPCLGGTAPTCSISGPPTVVQQSTGNTFTVSSNILATYAWSISGNGSLEGVTTGSSVTVHAGNPGTFTLTVVTSANGQTSTCTKQVSVVSNPSCGLTGPGMMGVSSVATYNVSSPTPGATFQWSITGNGTIIGPTTGSSVQVASGSSPGSGIGLSVVVSAGGFSGTCALNVDVVGTTCSIGGPVSVIDGTTSTYTVSTTPAATSYQWTIAGNGAISGGSTGSSVQVTAAGAGSFVLACHFTSSGDSANCQKMVAVQSSSSTCSISGESEVIEGSINHQYQVSTDLVNPTFAWSIAGNGTITSATTGSFIRVTAGATGTFTVTAVVSAGGVGGTCQKTVIVDATPTSRPGLNNNAKVMIHVLSATTKNQCSWSAAFPECHAVVTYGNLYPALYYSYVLMNDGYTDGGLFSGIGGIEFGIDYDGASGAGVDVYSWTACGSSEFPAANWPAPGSGNRVIWDASTRCQRYEPGGVGTGVVTTAGFFYMAAYSPGTLGIVVPPSGAVRVIDCQSYESIIEGNGVTHTPSHLGYAGFGGLPGYNPCGLLVPVLPTTWSGIKTLHR